MTQEADLLRGRPPEQAVPRRDPVLIVTAGVLSLLLWLAVVGQLVFFVPIIEGFKMKLPWQTELVVNESLWAVPAITIAAFVACVVLGKRSRWAWPFLLILLPLILNVLVCVSFYLPLMELHGLSGGGKK